MKYKGDTTLSFRLWVSKEQIPLDSGQMSLLRYISSIFQPISCQYPSRKHTRHTTSHHTEWVKKQFTHFTHSQLNLNLKMRRMSMSRPQSLSKSWRPKQQEQPLGIPGHNRPSFPQRRWNWNPGWCLSRKCSSSKLRLVPGQRESDMEVDQGWHLWDLMKYKGDTTLSFRLWVSKQQFPLDSGQMSLTQTCTSSQYHATIPVESIAGIPHHTTQNEFKSKRNSPTSLTVNKIWNLEMRRMSMSKLQSLSTTWRQRHPKQPLGIPGHKTPSLPQRRWNWPSIRCLSRKCSSSKLQLVPGQRESDMEVNQGWHLWDVMKYKGDTTLSFRLWVSKQQFPLDSGQMSLTQTCTSSQYHANIPVESIAGIPHHTTQNEFKSKRNSPTSLTVNKIWNLEIRRMSMSKLQSLSSWRQRHHEQPLGIPGHKTPSLPQCRWNCFPGRCLSRKCSSSKLQLVPGQRESDLEVDQGWHLWDVMKYKGDTTLTQFQTPSFQRTIPTGFRANVFDTEMHFQPISCQYPSRKHSTSYHTEWAQVKKKFTHFTDSQQDLEPGNAKDEHEQTTKPFKLATKTPWAATWNPGTQEAFAPSTPMELKPRLMLVTEVFVFKASASAWPKGKRLGSRSRLTSVRPCEIQMRHNSQFPTLSFQTTIPTGFRANVVDTEMHFQPISCQYPSRKHSRHTTSYHTEWVQVKKQFTHFTHSQLNLKTWKCEGWAWANYKAFQQPGDKDTPSSHLESRDTKGLHSLNADGIAPQVDACHGSVRHQSFS